VKYNKFFTFRGIGVSNFLSPKGETYDY